MYGTHIYKLLHIRWGFPAGACGIEPACHCRRHRSYGVHPWVGKTPWRRAWYLLQCSCLENPTDKGALRAAVHGVTEESDVT